MKSSIRLFAFFLMTLAGWGQAKKALPQADNLELRHLFADDEHDRGSEPFDVDENGKPVPHKEWKESPDMQVHDVVRRKRVHEMLNEGTVRTINDYTWASFIFQHGETPDDYLLAHVLAMVAASRGDKVGRWIAAPRWTAICSPSSSRRSSERSWCPTQRGRCGREITSTNCSATACVRPCACGRMKNR
jgi:hypothetical protein